MSSETNDYVEIELFKRLNLNDSDKNDSTLSTDELCKACTSKRFCENCLRNGILLSSFISDSDNNCNKRTTESNSSVYAPPLTNIYEYNLNLLAAVCMLEAEKNDCEPLYRHPEFIPEQQAITTTSSAALFTQVSHISNNSNFSTDGRVLSSKDEFGIFSQSKYRKLKMYHEIGSLETFSQAQGFCLSNIEDIIMVDMNNHRIKVFDKNGIFKFGFGKFGRKQGQLFYPHRVECMPDGGIIVCDRGMRLQIFDCFGNFEKEVLYPISGGFFIAFTVTCDGQIVALNSSSIVLIITKHGEIVRSFCCNDFVIDAWHIVTNGPYIYICDFKGHGVVVFDLYGKYQRKIGNFNDTPFPTGVDAICSNGAILISSCHLNSFVIKSFTTNGKFISNFTLPNQMRTSGLKVTKDGLVITLDKCNNRALIMKACTINNIILSE